MLKFFTHYFSNYLKGKGQLMTAFFLCMGFWQVQAQITLQPIGTYRAGGFEEGAAEIVAHDPETQRLFLVNASLQTVDIVDISNPNSPQLYRQIDATAYGASANSVAVKNGIVAVAIEANVKTDPGFAVLFNTNGDYIAKYTVGALPDMITFTPDGNTILVANEGEPNDDYTVDPEGSVSLIDIKRGPARGRVETANFRVYNLFKFLLKLRGIRIYGPNASVAQDLEPEYITVSKDGKKAYVSLQENNAFAEIDIKKGKVTSIEPFGYKPHYLSENSLDASDRDGSINLKTWPVFGMYQPDAIAAFEHEGQTFLISANEGDARDYDGFSEQVRVGDVELNLRRFYNAEELQQDENIGRLRITNALGNAGWDNKFERLFAFGGRSFSIWKASNGNRVFDSGDDFERLVAERLPEQFNSDNTDNTSFDNRSDDKGPEPEGVVLGKVNGRTYAFIGLERVGGIMIYDITNPYAPAFVDYVNNRNFDVDAESPEAGDLGPEGLAFIPAEESPNGQALLAVGNEVSGTLTIYQISTPSAFTLQILHASDLEGGVEAIENAPNFAAIVDALEDEEENSITLSAGDNYIPSPFFGAAFDPAVRPVIQSVYQSLYNNPGLNNLREGEGRIDISIMNVIGFDASAVGNHEFDAGTSIYASIIRPDIRSATDVRWLGTQFPYLSANLDFSGDPNLAPAYTDVLQSVDAFKSLPGDPAAATAKKLAPYTFIDVNGEKIGIVGATTQLLESITSRGGVEVVGPTVNDMDALADILQPRIDTLIGRGINKIILVTHLQQIALEKELIGKLRGVDVIIAGGSDALLAQPSDLLRPGDVRVGDYPYLGTNADGDPAAIVSVSSEYSYVGRLLVDFDAQGKLIPNFADPRNGVYAALESVVEEVAGDSAFVVGSKGELVQRLVNAVQVIVTAQDGNVFGLTDVFLEGRREQVRTQETNFGNLSADANLFIAQQYDPAVSVSIKNGGGIRASIGEVIDLGGGASELVPPQANPASGKLEGQVSELDIKNSLRFNNNLSILELTATELLAVVEHGVAATAPGATPGQFPQVGGMAFSFNPSLAAGDRVRTLVIQDGDGNTLDVVAEDGNVVGDPNRVIKVVTLDFLANGGDGYPFPALGENRVDLRNVLVDPGTATFTFAGSEQDALAEYLAAEYSATPFAEAETAPSADNRIQNLLLRGDGLAGAATVVTQQAMDEVILYPVPFVDELKVSSDLDGNISSVSVLSLENSNARLAPLQMQKRDAGFSIDMSTYPKGIYLVRFMDRSGKVIQERKVIKQ